ncbi:microprocessor complex subunit DGCR8-like [Rhopalosiphum padi]|uniref:microprocessor complex subunit DGCR8-like n=1 Tax=Rhopalosiphum padi TaxID=40932 RepID=UPI00298E8970|nr:microprocessor complex subunit DGCR8-like [Rhopalosiphum padi]XP_060848005.1 microprocessor complex subunit DGCR8-like [Rhopalosiphum padi]
MLSSDCQVSSNSDNILEDCPRKKTKLSVINEQLFDRDIDGDNSIDKNSQNYNKIEVDNYFEDQNLNKNQTLFSDISDDEDYNINKYEDSESEDYVPISDSEFELEKYVIDETNSKTSANKKTNDEPVKDVGGDANNYINNEKRITETYTSIGIGNDEVYDLLDKAYRAKNKKTINEHKKKTVTQDDFKEYEKTVLEEVSKNHFDILPENWIEVIHKSGMPIYLHKKSRVVTLSRPYFLGPGDPKSHLAPLSAISCLQYQKGLKNKEIIKNEPNSKVSKLGDMIIPNAKVETAQENITKESLTHADLREYCQSLFKFKIKKKESSCKKPKEENIKTEISSGILNNTKERASLPDSTKLISFPVQTVDHDKQWNRRHEWIMNPDGKSYVSILHEYLQQALKTQPWYEFKELENTETPYSATVMLNDVQYGVGVGNSKRQAKVNAAQATLDILIPEMKTKIDLKNKCDPVIFNQIKVTDPRVIEFCAKTTEPSPYSMLLVCLQRNFGECEVGIEYKLNNRRRKLNQCTMIVGKHTATVTCKNKRDGKQKAAQVILGLLHPHIDNWGSLLQLYGNRSIKNSKVKKKEEQEITQLQSKATANQPNFAILNKLKEEMLKVRDQRKLKETNEMLGHTMIGATGPYTIAIPSSSTSP